MKSNQRIRLIKVYPLKEWGIGGIVLIFCLFCAFMAAIARQYMPALGFLFFTLIPILLFVMPGVLEINEHIIVVSTPFTRHQIGWDEVEELVATVQKRYVSDTFGQIILYGQSPTGVPKKLIIPGPSFWYGNKKQITKIFAQQIKLRQIKARNILVTRPFGDGSSKTTKVGINSDDPELYVAAPPKYGSPISAPEIKANASAPSGSTGENPAEQKIDVGNLVLGAIGGFMAAMFSALVWGVIAYITHYELSIVSIGVGLLVGFVTRKLTGAGGVPTALMSAGFSLIGCMLGSTLGIILLGSHENLAVTVKILTNPALLRIAYIDAFSPIDILFYIIAIVNAFRVALK